MNYLMTIKPALEPKERYKIQDALEMIGYKVSGGGTTTDMSECDISFDGGTGRELSLKELKKL